MLHHDFVMLGRVLIVLHQHRLRHDVVALPCVRRCDRLGRVCAGSTRRAVRLVGGAAETAAPATMRSGNFRHVVFQMNEGGRF